MIVVKCGSESDLMREFSLRDDFNPEDKFLFLPDYCRDFCWYDPEWCYGKAPTETEQTGLGPLV